MITSSKVIRSLTMITLFASIGALLSTGVPDAFAMNSPQVGQNPNIPVVGGSLDLIVNGGTANELPHEKGIIRVYEPGYSPSVGGGVHPLVCDFNSIVALGGFTAGQGRVWEFRQAGNTAVANEYSITLTTDSLKVRFGVNGATVTPVKTAGVTLDDNQGVWVQVAGSLNPGNMDDVIDILTTDAGKAYRMATCGYDQPNSVTSQYDINDPFDTQPLVGGSIIGIDTTALLIAGISTSQLMILPALGIVAGGAFALLKFQLQRKEQ